MTGEKKTPGSGGAEGDSGGKPGENNEPPKVETVLFDTHQKVLDEKKAQSGKLKEANSKLAEFEKAEKERKEKALLDDGKAAEALETSKKELAEEKLKNKRINDQIVESRKLSSFLQSVEGGVDKRYWSLIDTEKIKVDENGQPDPESIKEYSASFVEQFPEVLAHKQQPGMPPGNPTPPANGSLTYEDWQKLPAKEMAKRINDVKD